MPLTLPVSDQNAMKALIKRRHPGYDCNLNHWEFCEDTYEGGREWFEKNIHKYLKEGLKEYSDRLCRSYRFNHTKEVVQLVTKYIFKQGVIRNMDDTSSALKDFWDQATLDGSSVDVFMKRVSDWTSINGRVWVAVDSKAPKGLLTKADEVSGKARIYTYLVEQEDMLDFSRDEWGKLNWVLYRIPYRDDTDPIESKGEVRDRYMLWTREEFFVLEERKDPSKSGKKSVVVVVRQGPNELGEVPLFHVDHLENDEHYAPPGLIDDIAYLDRAVANYLSNLDAIIQDQTFSQLVMPAQGILPGEEGYDKLLEMGTKRIFLYDGESQHGPEYLTPDAAQAAMIVSVIKMIIGEIYHSIGMAGERTKQDNAMGIDNSSGVAKAYDFDRMNALLAAKADMLERAECRLSYLVKRYAGEMDAAPAGIPSHDESLENLIKYPDSYDVRGLPDEFDIASNLALLDAPDELRRHQMSVLVEKIFPRLAKDLKEKIEKELKSWPVSEDDKVNESLSTVERLGSVVGKISTQVAGAAQTPGSGGGKPTGPKPRGKSKQGQNSNSK